MPADSRDSFYGKLLGNPSASKGGYARAKSLTKAQRSKIASIAANKRWSYERERASTKEGRELSSEGLSRHILFGI